MAKFEVKIIEAVSVRDLELVSCDLLEGEVALGLQLTKVGSEGCWEIINTSKVSPELYVRGRRGITLRSLGNAPKLSSGDVLVLE